MFKKFNKIIGLLVVITTFFSFSTFAFANDNYSSKSTINLMDLGHGEFTINNSRNAGINVELYKGSVYKVVDSNSREVLPTPYLISNDGQTFLQAKEVIRGTVSIGAFR